KTRRTSVDTSGANSIPLVEEERARVTRLDSVSSTEPVLWDLESSATTISDHGEFTPVISIETNVEGIPWLDLNDTVADAIHSAPPAAVSSPEKPAIKLCSHCGTKNTPMWRHGPIGYDILCNGCGVKWKRGRILQGLERAKKDNPHKQKKQKRPSTTASAPLALPLKLDPKPLIFADAPLDSPLQESTITSTSRRATFALPFAAGLPSSHRDRAHPARILDADTRAWPPLATPAQELRRQSLLAHVHPQASAPGDLEGAPLRRAFVCAALEGVQGDAIRVVADAVRWIQRARSASPEPPMRGMGEEIEMDVGALDVGEWEYLCGILVCVGSP
ncbi:hypothetical protein BC830DRAFT_1135983, partial [Chytriomyces sp. MP71]